MLLSLPAQPPRNSFWKQRSMTLSAMKTAVDAPGELGSAHVQGVQLLEQVLAGMDCVAWHWSGSWVGSGSG